MGERDDEEFEQLLERSSLGTAGARQLRRRTPRAQAQAVQRIIDLRNRIEHAPDRKDRMAAVVELSALLADLGYIDQSQQVLEAWQDDDDTERNLTLLSAMHRTYLRPQAADSGAATPGVRRLLVAVDIERYAGRGNRRQVELSRGLQALMRRAAKGLNLDYENWLTMPGGDGLLAILPPGTSEPAVVEGWVSTLDRLLRIRNLGVFPGERLRLRIAVHEGFVYVNDPDRSRGDAITTLTHLVNASPLRRTLRVFPDANVALILSNQVYRDTVQLGHGLLRPDNFVRVSVPAKGPTAIRQSDEAWICVPGQEDGSLGEPAADPALDSENPSRIIFSGTVTSRLAAFGNFGGDIVVHGPDRDDNGDGDDDQPRQ